MVTKHQEIYVPNGIQFGSKIAIIPPVSMDFCHSGDMSSVHQSSYCWINRGDPLGHYYIDVDDTAIPILRWFSGQHRQTATIPSPVSGLLVHSEYRMAEIEYALTAILLPDDEPACEYSKYMFQNLYNLCSGQIQYFL